MREIHGIAASPGMASGFAFLFYDEVTDNVPTYPISSETVEAELERFSNAVSAAKKEVELLRDRAFKEAGESQAAIFDAHLLMLGDPDVAERVKHDLYSTLMNVESIVFALAREMVDQLSASNDPYMQERVSDVHDVTRRLLGHLLKRERINLADLQDDVIIVAHDLLPSDMVGMARRHVKGIATEAGGRTSHAAILARAFEIPAVLGLGPFMNDLKMGTKVIVDGDKGLLVVDPDESALKKVQASMQFKLQKVKEFESIKALPAATK
ncbi:MAG: phosphoenolpyruvate--protein phosphotransferase, partial [Spirochaetia bacterium]|nr:phosphoenolpyruvate--protein phosphotransferase [Spirochaetia bacterium]